MFRIKNQSFEGPLHLLLHLIEERKLHISEVSLAEVTQEYMSFIERDGKSLGDTSQFVVVAATLLLIKARSLLPGLQITDEESKSIETLVNRVELLQMIRDRAGELGKEFNVQTIFSRIDSHQERNPVFAPHDSFAKESLFTSIRDLIQLLPLPEKLKETSVRTVIKIEDVINDLVTRFKSGVSYSFNSALQKYKNALPEEKRVAKSDAIVTFLALLELARKGIASLAQNTHFDDIEAKSV